MGLCALILCSAVVSAFGASAGGKVISFRNGGSGSYPDADPPLDWSPTQNVKWRWEAPVLGTTLSSPIIVGDRVITLAWPMTIVCLDKNSGKELWRRETHITPEETVDADVRRVHAAMVRDARIWELKGNLGDKEMGFGFYDSPTFERMRAKGTGPTAKEDQAYYDRRAAEQAAVLKTNETDRATCAKELAALEATVPKNSKGKVSPKELQLREISTSTPASPASDGERIFVCFEPGLLVCYDLDGKRQWIQTILAADGTALVGDGWNVYAETPSCIDGKLLVVYKSEIRVFDAATGKIVWRQTLEQPEVLTAASPSVGNAGGGAYCLTYGDRVRRLSDGAVLWRNDNPPSADMWSRLVTLDGTTLHSVSVAVRLPKEPTEQPRILWRLPEERIERKNQPKPKTDLKPILDGGHNYNAAVVHDGLIYVCRTMSVLDAETGAVVREPSGSIKLDYSDLTAAGRYLFMFDGSGNCKIMTTGREKPFEVVTGHSNSLEPLCASNPVFEGRRMYVRTLYSLYCIEKPE